MNHTSLAMFIMTSLTAISLPLLAVEPVNFTQTEVDEKEAILTDFPQMRSVKSSIATRNNTVVDTISALNPNNPDNVRRLESVLSEAEFDFLFPVRAPEYPMALCPGLQPNALQTSNFRRRAVCRAHSCRLSVARAPL